MDSNFVEVFLQLVVDGAAPTQMVIHLSLLHAILLLEVLQLGKELGDFVLELELLSVVVRIVGLREWVLWQGGYNGFLSDVNRIALVSPLSRHKL